MTDLDDLRRRFIKEVERGAKERAKDGVVDTGELAASIERRAKEQVPYGTGRVNYCVPSSGRFGMPAWLDRLLRDAGWDGYITMIEIGEDGRGVRHGDPDIGWVSIAELRELAERRTENGERRTENGEER